MVNENGAGRFWHPAAGRQSGEGARRANAEWTRASRAVYSDGMNTPPQTRSLAALLVLAIFLPLRAVAEVTVHSDFDGGSAEVVSVEGAKVRIMPALRAEHGWPCWWYFRLEGLEEGKDVTVEVQAQTREFRPGMTLAASWSQPVHAVFSADGVEWRQTEALARVDAKTASWRFTAPARRVWVAWGPPFVNADAEALLAGIAAKPGMGAERFELAKTRGGRAVPGIRIGPADAPRQVWVNARHHAWEAGGSWVGRGFIEWVTGDDDAARALRKTACIHFVPIMDVDSVALGAGGKEALPRDHNRDWSGEPVYPEIAAAQKRIRAIHAARGLDVYLDLHNPGPGDKAPFFFGPFDHEQLAGVRRRNYDRWMELAAESIAGPLKVMPRYRIASYVKTEEERLRMSSGWVRAHTGEGTISVTLETGWNSPKMTVEGYAEVGANLGRTLKAYLEKKEE